MSRLLGYLVTFLLLALLFEGVLRLAGCTPKAQIVEFHDSWGWGLIKGKETHRSDSEFSVTFDVNSKGLRGPETDYAKPANVKRILFVGDSFTLGYTVEDRDLFLRVLETDLRKNGHAVEVLNGGCEGWSTDQELAWLQDEGIKYRPDYVVLAPYLNDVFWNSQDHYTVKQKPLYAQQGGGLVRTNPRLEKTGATPPWAQTFALGNAIHLLRMGLSGKAVPESTNVGGAKVMLEYAPLLREDLVEIDAAWKITGALLGEFAKVATQAGAKPIALLVPTKWEIHPDRKLPARETGGIDPALLDVSKATRKYAELARAAGFQVVDPSAALKTRGASEPLYFEKDWHWNVAGNHTVAGVLLDAFEQPDLLGKGTGVVSAASEMAAHVAGKGIPTWIYVVGALWLFLGTFFWMSYKKENPVMAYLKVGAMIAIVAGVFIGIGKLAASLPPAAGKWIMPLIIVGLILFIAIKIGKRFGIITELYGSFLRRGHWYMLPMLLVMLSIGMLLVVAASSPFVAPFIYTLF